MDKCDNISSCKPDIKPLIVLLTAVCSNNYSKLYLLVVSK